MIRLCPALLEADLTAGEKACFMSHVVLWEKCVDENMPFISIFEDDVVLGQESNVFFRNYQWLEKRFNISDKFILNYETDCDPVTREKTNIQPFSGREFSQLKSVNYGMAGYLLTQSYVRYILDILKKLRQEDILPIDTLIFGRLLNELDYKAYQIEPANCIQEDKLNRKNSQLTSQLEDERQQRKLPKKRSLLEKILCLLNKPKRMIVRYQEKKYKEKNRIPFA